MEEEEAISEEEEEVADTLLGDKHFWDEYAETVIAKVPWIVDCELRP